jgi:chemotaxis protein CheD
VRLFYDAKLNRERIVIDPGEFCTSRGDRVIYTLLGSCVAVCLKDPVVGIAGMNHFMLPKAVRPEAIISTEAGRYGIQAMELLINDMLRKGADRRRLCAKVFGGGHVLNLKGNKGSIPRANIEFALTFLEMEGIPVLARDVGGTTGRKIFFFTDSGNVRVEIIGKASFKKMHGSYPSRNKYSNIFSPGNLTLFEKEKGARNDSGTHRR